MEAQEDEVICPKAQSKGGAEPGSNRGPLAWWLFGCPRRVSDLPKITQLCIRPSLEPGHLFLTHAGPVSAR